MKTLASSCCLHVLMDFSPTKIWFQIHSSSLASSNYHSLFPASHFVSGCRKQFCGGVSSHSVPKHPHAEMSRDQVSSFGVGS